MRTINLHVFSRFGDEGDNKEDFLRGEFQSKVAKKVS